MAKQEIKVLGKILAKLVTALGMVVEDIQRNQQGCAAAYDDYSFFEVAREISLK